MISKKQCWIANENKKKNSIKCTSYSLLLDYVGLPIQCCICLFDVLWQTCIDVFTFFNNCMIGNLFFFIIILTLFDQFALYSILTESNTWYYIHGMLNKTPI